jgi:uncharacterized protein (DUF169 family)
MDDDEQHLIIAIFHFFETARVLAVEDRIEFDVIGIIEIVHNIYLLLKAASRRRGRRLSMTISIIPPC